VKATTDPNRCIARSDFHPQDVNGIIGIIGDYTFKVYRIIDEGLKQISTNMMKREAQIYTCHAWLGETSIVVGSDMGDVLIFDYTGGYELVFTLSVSTPGSKIHCIATYSKGFIVGCEDGLLNVFEKLDEGKEGFKCSKIFRLPQGCQPGSLAVSPAEDTLLCCTLNNQIYILSLSNSGMLLLHFCFCAIMYINLLSLYYP
jgi:hypothetical protein